MFTTLAILLLCLFILGFWLVKESQVPTWLKVCTISLFFLFCVVLAVNFESSMGWAANGNKLDGIITIRYAMVKEPNPQTGSSGNIYLVLDIQSSDSDKVLLNMFGHKTEGVEPRLYKLAYSRKLHEALQKNVIPLLQKGQAVKGRFKRGGTPGNGDGDFEGESGDGHGQKGGKGKGGKKGKGSDSIEPNDPMFYALPPSYFQQKEPNE